MDILRIAISLILCGMGGYYIGRVVHNLKDAKENRVYIKEWKNALVKRSIGILRDIGISEDKVQEYIDAFSK